MHASRVLVTGDTIWKGASSVLPMSLSPDDNDDDGREYHDDRGDGAEVSGRVSPASEYGIARTRWRHRHDYRSCREGPR